MRADLYREFARVEDQHWWFRARRSIIRYLLARIDLPAKANLLEVGCGTGGNLSMLTEFGTLSAVEMDDDARVFANARGIVAVEAGSLPDQLAFSDRKFDFIGMFDVLEHIDDDLAALVALRHKLAPDGKLMLTVPAFAFLWGVHDDMNFHKKRYTRLQLIKCVKQAGYKVTFASYINFWLFPAIASVRVLSRLRGRNMQNQKANIILPHPLINRFLQWIFASEARLMGHIRLPFGVSVILLAQNT